VDNVFASRLFSTRGGTIAVGVGAAVLAAVILLVFLAHYRSSVNDANASMTVLVAKNLIQKGTPGDVIGTKGMFQSKTLPRRQLKDGAVIDASSLRSQVAAVDIYPGQQLTLSDFRTATAGAVETKLSEYQRAIAIPLDAAHGMIGNVQTGDHVDVMAGFNVQRIKRDGTPMPNAVTRPVIKTIMQNVLVVGAPAGAKGGGLASSGSSNIVLRANDRQAAQLAFASDNGKVWVVLRPASGSLQTRPSLVSLEAILLGVPSIRVLHSFGGR
jgi:Flp pilus assembly protein CpaB